MTLSSRQKKKKTRILFQYLILFVIACYIIFSMSSCSSNAHKLVNEDPETTETPTDNDSEDVVYNQNVATPNVLLIIADDMGMDATPYATQLSSIKPYMPNLDKLTALGVRFQNTWSYPRCTPTRGTIITGKHAVATGLLSPGDDINSKETTLQSYINTNGTTTYATALLGKWHLSTDSTDPENLGIDSYKGNTRGGLADYYNWDLHEDGTTTSISNYYGTTAYTDYAIDWINAQTEPWFCWLAYNAAHIEFHTPKDSSLYTHTGSDLLDMYIQMLEAMDSEMGRLLESIPKAQLANTTIIFVGDNGTPAQVAQTPFSRSKAKGSLYNGGVNVPLVVAGANVTRQNQSEQALIQTTDLFATIADLCGLTNVNTTESISFKTLLSQETSHTRNYLFTEGLNNGPAFGGYTLRDSTYKYIYNEDDDEHYLYNVITDYSETINLYDGDLSTEEQTALTNLQAEYNRIKGIN